MGGGMLSMLGGGYMAPASLTLAQLTVNGAITGQRGDTLANSVPGFWSAGGFLASSGSGYRISGVMELTGAQLAAVGANATATVKGNRSAADAGSDVDIASTATRSAGALARFVNNGTPQLSVSFDGRLDVIAGNTQTTVGAAGGATAQPATPLGYLLCRRAGVNIAIPYHNP